MEDVTGKKRVVVWYSCGVTSAIAAKLTINKYKGILPVEIVYTDTASEHPDNTRFMRECEEWYGQKIVVLKSDKYADIWDVYEKTRYLAGIKGARCTTELKKKCRQKYEDLATDIQVFGFDLTEEDRAARFRNNNPEVTLETPLIEQGLTKHDCLAMLQRMDIELPTMYKMGYKNNNCIGCPKGGAGYWMKIKKDFPDVFERMVKVEEELDVAICKTKDAEGNRQRLFLKDIPEGFGNYQAEENIECGILCLMTMPELQDCT